MIAALMLQGKSVLFVAQKQAALDVVRNNLAAAGLEDYLLEIFSIKGKKKPSWIPLQKGLIKNERT